ncbi:FadR/GntR family transcriptional regulator [Aeromicrobium sp. P5_D10]
MTLSPVTRVPLSLEVAGRLRAAVIDGTFPGGSELPTEAELAQTFAVGRSTIREALRILQAGGLVSGADTVSTSRPRVTYEQTADSAAYALSTAVQVAAIPLADLVELRIVLESEAISKIRTVPADTYRLLQDMDEAAARCDLEAFHLADVAFHTALVVGSGNVAFGLVTQVLRDAVASHLRVELDKRAEGDSVLHRLCDEHRRIVEALAAGDAERASKLAVAHLEGFYGSSGR